MSEQTRAVQKRDAVERIHAALMDLGYRCVKTGMVNFAQNALQDAASKRTPTGENLLSQTRV